MARIKTADRNKLAGLFIPAIAALLASRLIYSESYKLLLALLFAGAVLFLYLRYFEFFILFVLIINQNFFSLLPGESEGRLYYQDLLFFILLITGGWYFLRKKLKNQINFSFLIISFLVMSIAAIFNSHFQGQPIVFGLKAIKGYWLILFYYVFLIKNINMQKLFRMIIITGIFLALANNIQYIFFGNIKIFYFSNALERASQLRLLIGDFFTLFSPIVAFSEYLATKKKFFLIAFIYMLSTVIIQGKTRAVIWGFLATVLLLLYFSKRLNFMKTVLIGVPLMSFIIWIGPAIQSSFISEIYNITKREFREKSGNVGIRFDAYNYYFGEIWKSPLIGRGIWSDSFDAFMGDNPQNMEQKGLYLGDIGITGFLFHFGLMGVVWLLILFKKIYKLAFIGIGKLKKNINFGLIGYFIFGFVTMPTLNCFLNMGTIIYLALVLALLNQQSNTSTEYIKKQP